MKRTLLAVLFFVLVNVFITPYAFAQTPSQNNPYPARTNSDVPQNLSTHTQSVFIETLVAISCVLTNVDPVNPQGKCLGVDPKTRKIGYVENDGGLIGLTGSMIAGTFVIPVSSADYIHNLAANFGFTKKTYALEGDQRGNPNSNNAPPVPDNNEGYGFESLRPVLQIWLAFRNLVYVLFVIIFLFVGLGIMFRFKIDPRTVMTIQNQIPKAIVILVLITFSYAISGFLVDIMYLLIYAIFAIFSQVDGFNLAKLNPTNLYGNSPFQAIGGLGGVFGLANGAAESAGDILSSLFSGRAGQVLGMLISGLVTGVIGGAINPIGFLGSAVGLGIGYFFGTEIVTFLAQWILYIIFAIAITIGLFRLWITLLKSYVYILIATIFAPLWIGGSLIPGSPMTLNSWFRFLVSYLLVFPTTIVMFILAFMIKEKFGETSTAFAPHISDQAGTLIAANGNFVPPLVGNPGDVANFGSLMALIIILMTPEVVQIVKDALKAPNVTYTKSIGAALGGGKAVAGGFAGGLASRLYRTDNTGAPKGALATLAARRFGGFAAYFSKHGSPEHFQNIKNDAKIENIRAKPENKRNWLDRRAIKKDDRRIERERNRDLIFEQHHANNTTPRSFWVRRQFNKWMSKNHPNNSGGNTPPTQNTPPTVPPHGNVTPPVNNSADPSTKPVSELTEEELRSEAERLMRKAANLSLTQEDRDRQQEVNSRMQNLRNS